MNIGIRLLGEFKLILDRPMKTSMYWEYLWSCSRYLTIAYYEAKFPVCCFEINPDSICSQF